MSTRASECGYCGKDHPSSSACRTKRIDDDNYPNIQRGPDLTSLLAEPDAPVTVTRHELLRAIQAADRALDGVSNDAEHDALYDLREILSEWVEAPERRRQA